MRILTLNTWHNNGPWLQRHEALIEGIVEYAPDILLLQELFDADWSNELQARLGYPHLVSTECMHSGLVLLSKLPLRGNEIYRMNTKSPFENYYRYALCAELNASGERLNVFNTHLSWEVEDHSTREMQVRELWSFIETHRSESGFAIVGGDFNCTPDSPAMSWFLGHSVFMDTYETLHSNAADSPGATEICLRKIIARFFPTAASTTCSQKVALRKIDSGDARSSSICRAA